MRVKTIRDVDENTWKTLKETAGKRKMKISNLLTLIVREFSKKEVEGIIPPKPILTAKEAKEMGELIKTIRKEAGFR